MADRTRVRRRYEVRSDRSALIVEATSNLGMIIFAVPDLEGQVGVPEPMTATPPEARIELRADRLTSGNSLYDRELRQRIDVRRHPRAVAELRTAVPVGVDRYRVTGAVTFNGVTRSVTGDVFLTVIDDGGLVAAGEGQLDMRDFGIPPPKMLMLKIEPRVRVRLHLEAERAHST